jgi:uncharacterized membrane-anchored protein
LPKPVVDPAASERAKSADQLLESVRFLRFVVPVMAGIALLDLLTGWITDSWRWDVALLLGAASGLFALVAMHRLAANVRADRVPRRSSPRQVILAALGSLVSFGVTAVIGYLLGGFWLAVALVVIEALLAGIGLTLGVRRRKERRAD